MEKIVPIAPTINIKKPSNHPARENAYGNANAPAPNVALHRLNTDPRTLPSRNHDENASFESNIRKNGVCGGENNKLSSLPVLVLSIISSLKWTLRAFSLNKRSSSVGCMNGFKSGKYPIICTERRSP